MTNVKLIVITSIIMGILFITGSSAFASLRKDEMVPNVPTFTKTVPAPIAPVESAPVAEISPVQGKAFEPIPSSNVSSNVSNNTVIRSMTVQEQIDALEKRVRALESR